MRSANAPTIAYDTAFICLGFVVAIFGPTLAGLAANTNTSLATISTVFVTNSFGRMCGSLVGGRLLDRVPGHLVMVTGFVILALTFVAIPLAQISTLLAIILAVSGFGQNMIDVGANTLIVWIHGAKVGPYMATLHFAFGVGAFLAPLFATRVSTFTGGIEWVYWAVAGLTLPFIIWLLSLPSPTRRTASSLTSETKVNWTLVALIAAFFFFVVGVELGMSLWTFTYGIKIHLDNSLGPALLASPFWGAYSLGRLIAIPVSIRVSPERMLLVDVLSLIVSATVFLLGQAVQVLTWLGVLGIGLSVASVFPTMLTFTGRQLNVTGKINGLLFTASTTGSMFFPWLIGQLFDRIGPQALPLLMVCNSCVIAAIFLIMHPLSRATSGPDLRGSQPHRQSQS